MCLDVDLGHGYQELSHGTHRARKAHTCRECHRQIEPGELYRFWTIIDYDDGLETQKMCAHCWATIELGAAITGCPKQWYWDQIHDLDPDQGGFVGDILEHHELTEADTVRMLRRVVQRRRQWRRPDGELYPLPLIPAAA